MLLAVKLICVLGLLQHDILLMVMNPIETISEVPVFRESILILFEVEQVHFRVGLDDVNIAIL